MIESKSKVIGNCTYTVQTLGAVSGRRLLLRLSKVLGPAVARLDSSASDKLGQALTAAVETLSEADVEAFCEAFAPKTTVKLPDGREPVLTAELFDSHFAGKYGDMVAWLAFALEVNFGSFFREVAGKLVGGAS